MSCISLEGVGLEFIVCLESEPVAGLSMLGGVILAGEELGGQVGGEVVLTEGFNGGEVGAVPEN